jgi:murein L,D-transpeptidase YafK
MKNLGLLTAMILISFAPTHAQLPSLSSRPSFLASQLNYPRVRVALQNQGKSVDDYLKINNIDKNTLQIKLMAFKAEGVLELWAKSDKKQPYILLKEFDICAKSGRLGPKLKQGDGQVPEGNYFIDRFNPNSQYHLSLGISYPNNIDKKRSEGLNPGGDIFIHGKCVTIGCLPMTDEIIEQIYLLAVYARNSGQKQIPVSIFPFRMTNENLRLAENTELGKLWISFWRELAKHHNNK